MGHPKKQKKKFETPRTPFSRERLSKERKIVNEFGLRRKKELWKAESILRDFRRRARELLAKPDEKKQKELFDKLGKIGIPCSKLEDVLDTKLEDLLSRRLQTVVSKRLSMPPKRARQLIVHRHILVDGQKVQWPSYLVPVELESRIELNAKLREKEVK
ncbi:MAG: 30S ribosomal protein S4 [Candidatus Aenigmarchaeota archaeon]|nr:30S ribosomal protein S4 [Candidatus Aenigmarchaeota archaeon]